MLTFELTKDTPYLALSGKLWSYKGFLLYVPQGLIDNMAALVQIMAWRQAIIWTNDAQGYWCKYASLCLNDLTEWLKIQ